MASTRIDIIDEMSKRRFSEYDSTFFIIGTETVGTLSDASVSMLSPSVQYAELIFEGARIDRVQEGRDTVTSAFHYQLNLMRMDASSQELGYGKIDIENLTIALARISRLNRYNSGITYNGEPVKTVYVRPFVHLIRGESIGVGQNLIGNKRENTVVVGTITIPFPSYFGKKLAAGVSVYLTDKERDLTLPTLKVAPNYQFPGREKARCLVEHPGCMEVLFTRNGVMNEGSAENLGLIRGNTFVTPPVESGCLPGFTMQVFERIAETNGLVVRREDFEPKDLKNADAFFMCGNAAGGVPIDCVIVADGVLDGVKRIDIPSSTNAVLGKLMGEYSEVMGGSQKHGDFWLRLDKILHTEDTAYLDRVRARLLEQKKGSEWKVTSDDLGGFAEKRMILRTLNPPKLQRGARKRIREQMQTYRGFILK